MTALWVKTICHHRPDLQATVPCTRSDAHEALRRSTISAAEALGLSDRIGSLEKGKQADINGAKLSTLLKLCLALNCRLTDILDDPETLDLLRKYEER